MPEEVNAVGDNGVAAVEGAQGAEEGAEPVNPVSESIVKEFLDNADRCSLQEWLPPTRDDLGEKVIILTPGKLMLSQIALAALAKGKVEIDESVSENSKEQQR
jgi:hypothetical protein